MAISSSYRQKNHANLIFIEGALKAENGSESDTESQVSAAKSDAAGSDAEEDQEKSKISSNALNVGIPWIPEIELVDLTVSHFAAFCDEMKRTNDEICKHFQSKNKNKKTLNFQDKPVTERYRAIKQRAQKLVSQRENQQLSDTEVQDIVRSVKSKLKPNDLNKLNDMADKHVRKQLK